MRLLPKYVPGLKASAILIFGMLFFGGIQILHVTFSNLHGRQRQFFLHSIIGLCASCLFVAPAALRFHTLAAVAIAQVLVLFFWWSYNEWALRDVARGSWHDWLRTLLVFAWSAAVFFVVPGLVHETILKMAGYYVFVVPFCLALFGRREFRRMWRLLSRRPEITASLTDRELTHCAVLHTREQFD